MSWFRQLWRLALPCAESAFLSPVALWNFPCSPLFGPLACLPLGTFWFPWRISCRFTGGCNCAPDHTCVIGRWWFGLWFPGWPFPLGGHSRGLRWALGFGCLAAPDVSGSLWGLWSEKACPVCENCAGLTGAVPFQFLAPPGGSSDTFGPCEWGPQSRDAAQLTEPTLETGPELGIPLCGSGCATYYGGPLHTLPGPFADTYHARRREFRPGRKLGLWTFLCRP